MQNPVMETAEPGPVFDDTPYPAKSNKAAGVVGGIAAEAEIVYFSDKIMVLVSQGGRLAQWIQVPLSAPSAASVDAALPPSLPGGPGGGTGGNDDSNGEHYDTSLLPSTHLTPRTLLGGGGEARETFGQLVAAQIGSLLALRDARDQRTLVVGLGLDPRLDVGGSGGGAPGSGTAAGSSVVGSGGQTQAVYFDLVELVQKLL